MSEKKMACDHICDDKVIAENRCECVNIIKAGEVKNNPSGIGSITIHLHYCSEQERNDLVTYLEHECWDFTETSKFVSNEET